MTDELLTTAEAMQKLNVSYNTIIKWLNKGIIPGFKLCDARKRGGTWRIRREDLDGYIDKRASMCQAVPTE